MKHQFIRLLTVISIFALLMCGCAQKPDKREDYTVRVMLRPCEGITIEGDNIADVKAGRNVSFKVTLNEGYIYIGNTADAEFDEERGRLRLDDVIAPATVDMIVAKESEVFRLSVKKSVESAEVIVSGELFAYPADVKVCAVETENLSFEGWSEGGFLSEGGTLLSEDAEYTFRISENRSVYANFSGFSDYTITYHLNGGVTADGADSLSVTKQYSDTFSMQQTLHADGSFYRKGYSCIGYSTEPAEYSDYESCNDIPGFANMGGVCRADNGSLDLYAVWAKETPASDFKYSSEKISYISDSRYNWGKLDQRKKSEDGIKITGYNGSDSTVVIPEEIDGLKVMEIAGGAFSGGIERVVIPRTVKNIQLGAFSDCEALREVVFFDSVVSVWDKSFNPNVKTVILNSQRLPVYSGAIEGSFCIKYERLRQAQGKKIVVVSGSSSLNGLDSALFEKLMPGYSVINYGTNVANPSLFFLDVISKYVSKGDIVVHAPEFFDSSSMGSNKFHAKMFRGNEQCYDIFRDADISKYTGFWESFREFQVGNPQDSSLVPAIHQSGKEYQLPTEMNKYGDRSTVRKSVRGSFGGAAQGFSYNKLNHENLNEIYKIYRAKGAKLYMSFGTYDKARLHKSATTQSEYDRFTDSCADKLDYPVISNVGTYVMEHKYFFDSEWHLNDEGAQIRTQNLAEDIKAQLEKERGE